MINLTLNYDLNGYKMRILMMEVDTFMHRVNILGIGYQPHI